MKSKKSSRFQCLQGEIKQHKILKMNKKSQFFKSGKDRIEELSQDRIFKNQKYIAAKYIQSKCQNQHSMILKESRNDQHINDEKQKLSKVKGFSEKTNQIDENDRRNAKPSQQKSNRLQYSQMSSSIRSEYSEDSNKINEKPIQYSKKDLEVKNHNFKRPNIQMRRNSNGSKKQIQVQKLKKNAMEMKKLDKVEEQKKKAYFQCFNMYKIFSDQLSSQEQESSQVKDGHQNSSFLIKKFRQVSSSMRKRRENSQNKRRNINQFPNINDSLAQNVNLELNLATIIKQGILQARKMDIPSNKQFNNRKIRQNNYNYAQNDDHIGDNSVSLSEQSIDRQILRTNPQNSATIGIFFKNRQNVLQSKNESDQTRATPWLSGNDKKKEQVTDKSFSFDGVQEMNQLQAIQESRESIESKISITEL